MRIAERETFRITKLISRGWTSRQVVVRWRRAEREEVIARARRIRLAVTAKERVCISDAMIDAYVVAVDVRALFTVCREVSPRAGKVRKRERVNVVQGEGRERSAARTVAEIVTGNRRAVRGEDRSDNSLHSTAARQFVISKRLVRLQQLTEITDAHARSRDRHCLRIACAAKDRRAVSLAVQ